MLLVSDFDILTEPVRSIIILLQLALAIGCIIIGIIAIISSKNSEMSMSKSYLLGIATFFILIGGSRMILVHHDYYAADDLDLILWKIANIIILGGFTFLTYTIETHVYQKTKHIFSVIGAILTVTYAIMPDKGIATILLYVATILLIILPVFIYIIMAKNATGTLRKRAMIILIGMIILLVAQGTGLFENLGLMTREQASIFAPPFSLLGLVICGYGFITMSK